MSDRTHDAVIVFLLIFVVMIGNNNQEQDGYAYGRPEPEDVFSSFVHFSALRIARGSGQSDSGLQLSVVTSRASDF